MMTLTRILWKPYGTEEVTHLMPETNRFEDVKQVIWPIQIIFHGQKLDHLGPYQEIVLYRPYVTFQDYKKTVFEKLKKLKVWTIKLWKEKLSKR